VHQRRTGFALHFCAGFLARGLRRRAAVQDAAGAFDVGELGRDGAFGHHDVRGNPACPRGQRQRCAVIAGRVRHHATLRFFFVERPHRIAGTAKLERTAHLQVFALEKQGGTGKRIQFR